MDLAAAGAAAGKSPRSAKVWGAIAFVVGATVLDVIVARGVEPGSCHFPSTTACGGGPPPH